MIQPEQAADWQERAARDFEEIEKVRAMVWAPTHPLDKEDWEHQRNEHIADIQEASAKAYGMARFFMLIST
jgi:hypothetical protein